MGIVNDLEGETFMKAMRFPFILMGFSEIEVTFSQSMQSKINEDLKFNNS